MPEKLRLSQEDKPASSEQWTPQINSKLTPHIDDGKPRMLPYNLKQRRAHDAVCWFDLMLSHVKGLSDCLVNVVRRNRDETEDETL